MNDFLYCTKFDHASTVNNVSISEAESKSTVYIFYKAKYFQAFYYSYKLARDCRRRIGQIIKCNDVGEVMSKDVFIKIGIVGKFTDADLKLVSKGRGNINYIAKRVYSECILICNLYFFFEI